MKEVTKLMIEQYNLKKLKLDFMGYSFNNINQLSYHHLIIPRRLNGEMTFENGAILRQNTSHDYLHRIERIDYDMYLAITYEMIDEKIKGYIDVNNLIAINDILNEFEKEYYNLKTKSGTPIIRKEYTKRLFKN